MVWSAGRDASDVRQSSRDVGIRLDHPLNAVSYGENFGYGINPEWHGRRNAGKACTLFPH